MRTSGQRSDCDGIAQGVRAISMSERRRGELSVSAVLLIAAGIASCLATAAQETKPEPVALPETILSRLPENYRDANSIEVSFCKANQSVCQSVGRTMDGFVEPLTGFAHSGRADAAKEKAAYEAYLDSPDAADSKARTNVAK
jgi:hypothetical protein